MKSFNRWIFRFSCLGLLTAPAAHASGVVFAVLLEVLRESAHALAAFFINFLMMGILLVYTSVATLILHRLWRSRAGRWASALLIPAAYSLMIWMTLAGMSKESTLFYVAPKEAHLMSGMAVICVAYAWIHILAYWLIRKILRTLADRGRRLLSATLPGRER